MEKPLKARRKSSFEDQVSRSLTFSNSILNLDLWSHAKRKNVKTEKKKYRYGLDWDHQVLTLKVPVSADQFSLLVTIHLL